MSSGCNSESLDCSAAQKWAETLSSAAHSSLLAPDVSLYKSRERGTGEWKSDASERASDGGQEAERKNRWKGKEWD